jgi:hypothetical protein
MPTLLRWKGYRFFFYSADFWEPAHIHVYKDGRKRRLGWGNLTVALNFGVCGQRAE